MNYIAKKIALQEKNILNHADLYLDYNNRIAFHKNRKINLTVKEFDILFFLASYPGQERIVICFKEEPSGYWCAGGRFYL